MLSVILATEDPYEAKNEFLRSGWKLEFETPRDSDDKLVCVKIGDAEVMLGVDSPEFLPEEDRPHKGAGMTIYIEFEKEGLIKTVFESHKEAKTAIEELSSRPWGGGIKAFHAKMCGYKFLLAGK